jgi:phospholipid/cholesterol/gamma-HCH transport system substrate-binding protein
MSPTARLGAFMLAALVVVGVFIIKIEQIPIGAAADRQRVKAAFPSVAGLDEKSPVRVAGVRVGIVEKVELDGTRALATLAIERAVTLREGARAEVTSLGILGDKYVELYPGDPGAPVLAPGSVLPGISPVGFDQVLKTASDVGGDLQAVTSSLRMSLGGAEGQRRLDEIIENIRQLSADLRSMVAANREEVDATVANFRDFSATLKTELPRLADKIGALADRVDTVVAANEDNFSESLANIKELSASLRTSADNLNEITGKINRGEGSIGKLVNDPETVDNLNSTLKSVESGVESLKNTVGRAERFTLEINLRSEALPGIDDSRSAFGFDLFTTPKRFWRLELVDSPFGRTRTSTETITTTYPDGHSETITEEVTKQSDTATVNAQVGFRLPHDVTLRGGLFESRGGVGVDKGFLNNRLRLTLDVYDFNRQPDAPHLRFEGRYKLGKGLFAFAGWDDPTFSDRSSVLFGAGYSWIDEDIKYYAGTAAIAAP